MQFEVKIDSSCIEPKIIILTASMTEDVNMILNKLSNHVPQIISGGKDGKIEVIDQGDLIRIYTSAGKVFAVTHVTYWMEHSIAGVFSYFGIFVLIFVIMWMIQFMLGKHNVKKINENLHNVNDSRDV